MATSQTTVDYLLEQIVPAGSVTAKKMFGEYALYRDNKVVALVCDDQLFVKITPAGPAFLGACKEAPPYPGAKLCFLITADRWEDREWISRLIQITSEALPAAAKKKAKRKPGKDK